MKDFSKVGYALSSAGLLQETESIMRIENPTWDNDKIAHEMDKLLKEKTIYNGDNKKPKKVKDVPEEEILITGGLLPPLQG